MSLSGHQSAAAKSVDWLTPPEWIEKLGPFDLDPCAAPAPRPWPTAATHFTREDDGLMRGWFGRVWMNPPFGREAATWMARLSRYGNGIALIPARTETAMFCEHVWPKAHAICFVRGRPHFHRPDGARAAFNSGAPIALVAYGAANRDALFRADLGTTLIIGRA